VPATEISPHHYPLLAKAARLFNEVLGIDPLLLAIRDFVRDAVQADSVSLLWLERNGAEGRYILAYNHLLPDAPRIVDPLERRFVSQVVRDRTALILEDATHHPSFRPSLSAEFGFTPGPMVIIPLIRGAELRGVLEVARSAGGRPFTDDVRGFLELIGEDIVVSVANAFLYGEVVRVSEENRVLYQMSIDLSRSLSLEELLKRILDLVGRIVPYDASGIYLIRDESREIEWLEFRGYDENRVDAIRLKVGEGIVGWAAEREEAAIVPDVRDHPRYVSARATTRSEMVVPIRSAGEDRVIGAFNVESDELDAYNERDLARLEAFASLASVAVERELARRQLEEKIRIDRELDVARRIQQMFLPRRALEIRGFDVWGAHFASIETSGDYYDVIPITPGNIGVAIADVSGKGVPAALIMASLRAGLISEIRNVYSIREILERVNRFLFESTDADAFVTAFYGVINTPTRNLTFVNAGHNPPLLLRANGDVHWLFRGGIVLGAFADSRYEEERVRLGPGDVLVLYTDGITEARGPGDDLFGTERLVEVVRRSRGLPAEGIGRAVLATVDGFAGSMASADDRTLLVIRTP
jgi:sigma-B regulation protein RsbU (phosphoserine phosphatase)